MRFGKQNGGGGVGAMTVVGSVSAFLQNPVRLLKLLQLIQCVLMIDAVLQVGKVSRKSGHPQMVDAF